MDSGPSTTNEQFSGRKTHYLGFIFWKNWVSPTGSLGIKLFSAQFCTCVHVCVRMCVHACLWVGAHWCMGRVQTREQPWQCQDTIHLLSLETWSPASLELTRLTRLPGHQAPPVSASQNWDDRHTSSCVLPLSQSGFSGSNSGLHVNVTRIYQLS